MVVVVVVGGFLSGWLTRWIAFLLSFRPSFLSPPRDQRDGVEERA